MFGSLTISRWSNLINSIVEYDDDRRNVVHRTASVRLQSDAFSSVMWLLQVITDVGDSFLVAERVPQAVTG